MAIFSDDPDALEVVLGAPVLHLAGMTFGAAGFLSMVTVAYGALTFGGLGHLRFPTNEKVAHTVLVDDGTLLSVCVDESQLLSVQVLEEADPGSAAVAFASPHFGTVTMRGVGSLAVLYDTVNMRGSGYLRIEEPPRVAHVVLVDDDSLLSLLVDDAPVYTVQVLED